MRRFTSADGVSALHECLSIWAPKGFRISITRRGSSEPSAVRRGRPLRTSTDNGAEVLHRWSNDNDFEDSGVDWLYNEQQIRNLLVDTATSQFKGFVRENSASLDGRRRPLTD
jgi:hypothetical protein